MSSHMNKGCCYKNTCTEVFTGKKDLGGNLEPFDFFGCHGEAAS